MYCINCGEQVPDGNKFCNNCGKEVIAIDNNQPQMISQSQMTQPQVQVEANQVNQTPPSVKPKKKKMSPLVIVLIVIGGIVGLFILFLVAVYFLVVKNSSQIVCTCNGGDITLIYNDETIIGYTANGFTYDLDEQRGFVEQLGIEEYLRQFEEWFSSSTGGTCTYSKTIPTDKPKTDTELNTKTVGGEKYGYINIPNDWYDFHDVDGNDSLQYSYGTIFIVSLNYFEDESYSAKELAQNYMYNKQQSTDVEGVTGATVTIGNNNQYTAYQVYMYYPQENIYLITYWFEAEDGKVHYMALEGPGEVNEKKISDFLSIPESFHLNK